MAKASEQMEVETPDGKISVNKHAVDPTPQKITVIAGDKLKQLLSLDQNGSKFIATYLPDERKIDLKVYDSAFRAWQLSDSKRHSKEEVVNLLGGYLGNKCVRDLNMEWVLVTDEYGTDYAVESKVTEVMAFPFSTVLKRIENQEYDFLYNVYYTIKQMVESGEYKLRTSSPPK